MSYVEGKTVLSRSLDLAAASVLACAAMAAAFTAVPPAAQILLGLPLVLVLPGYALTAAATPRLGRGGADKVVFTLATSIAVAVLGGLLLNFTSWGLERRSWSVFLAAFTFAAATVAAIRRAGVASPPPSARHRVQALPLLLLAVAALIAVAAVGISRRGAIQADQQSTFTQLWMLPRSGEKRLRLGVINHEGSSQRYRIDVRARKRQLSMFRFELVGGASWTRTFRIPTNLPPRTRIEADLYRATNPSSVYRHVTFWTP